MIQNILTALESAGARPEDVVRTVIYVASPVPEDLCAVWTQLNESPLAPAFTTASTLLGVAQLGFPGQLVEIDVTAALMSIPADGRRATTTQLAALVSSRSAPGFRPLLAERAARDRARRQYARYPGLPAKPIIDLDVVVPAPEQVPAAIAALGRRRLPTSKATWAIAGRRSVRATGRPSRATTTSMSWSQATKPTRTTSYLRDRLRQDPDASVRYAARKRELGSAVHDRPLRLRPGQGGR